MVHLTSFFCITDLQYAYATAVPSWNY